MVETQSPILFSNGAVDELLRIQREERLPEGQFLRVGVKGGGCAGFSYVLQTDQITEHDDLYDFDGVVYILDRRHKLYIEGMTIHYSNGLDARGFEFQNPQATSTCGCGSSFGA
jgi:iron-sulfur cluster assembly protein